MKNFVILLLFVSFISFANEKETGVTCIPPFWGGILAGSSEMKDVQALHGQGLYAMNKYTDGGSLFYCSKDKKISMEVSFTTDLIVYEVILREGCVKPKSLKNNDSFSISQMISNHLTSKIRVGVWGEINFSSKKSDVAKNMGEPKKINKEDGKTTYIYYYSGGCELYEGISFVFKNGKIIEIIFWANFA